MRSHGLPTEHGLHTWMALTDGSCSSLPTPTTESSFQRSPPQENPETLYYFEHGPVWSPDSTRVLLYLTSESDKAAIMAMGVDPDTPSITFHHWDDWEYGIDYAGGLAWQAQSP